MNTQRVELRQLDRSTVFRRKHKDDAKLRELAASIMSLAKQKAANEGHDKVDLCDGILEPAIVRPGKKPGRHELVAGDRRTSAMELLKGTEMLVIVRDLTDAQVLELQLVENGQRADFHPLEEAEAICKLHSEHGYSVEDLMTKLGKNERFIRARLTLASQLCPEARDAFEAGLFDERVALALARVPVTELQRQATKDVLEGGEWLGDGGKRAPMNARQAIAHVKQRFMLTLAKSPFPKGDADLIPEAGTCTACPKRTGAQAALFEDLLVTKADADLCTDPGCYKTKADAAKQREVAKVKEKGGTTLSDEEAAKVFTYGVLRTDAKYLDISAKCYDDKQQRTWKQILGKHVKPVVTFNPMTSHRVELIAKADVKQALADAGVKIRTTSSALPDTDQQKKDREETRLKTKARELALDRAAAIFETKGEKEDWPAKLWRYVAERETSRSSPDAKVNVVRRRGLVEGKISSANALDAIGVYIAKATGAQLRGLFFELLILSSASWDSETFLNACELCACDWKGLLKQATKEVRDEAKAKAKTKAKSGGAKKAKDEEGEEEGDDEAPETGAVAKCRVCGCTDNAPCLITTEEAGGEEACEWIHVEEGEEPLCSACARIADDAVDILKKKPGARADVVARLAEKVDDNRTLVAGAIADAIAHGRIMVDGEQLAVPKKPKASGKAAKKPAVAETESDDVS